MTVVRSEHQQIPLKQGKISAVTDWFKTEITAEKLLYWAFVGVFFSIPIGISPALICGVVALLFWVLSGTVLRVGFFSMKAGSGPWWRSLYCSGLDCSILLIRTVLVFAMPERRITGFSALRSPLLHSNFTHRRNSSMLFSQDWGSMQSSA
jgi:hypothetical protein